MNKKNSIFYVTNIAVSILALVLTFTVASPCPKGMICKQTTLICQGLFLVIAVLGLVGILTERLGKRPSKIINLLTSLCVLGSSLTFSFRGGCKIPTMVCNTRTIPVIAFCTIIVAVNCLANSMIPYFTRKSVETDNVQETEDDN